MAPRDVGLALLVVLAWGLNFTAIVWSVAEVPPLLLTALRYLLAAVPAIFFIRPPKVKLPILITYGLCVGVLQFGFLFPAVKLGMPAGLASVVMQCQAFFTMGLAILFLRERPSPVQLAGVGVALLGISAIAAERLEGASLLPLLMTLAAALAWGASNIVAKKAGKVDMLAMVVWGSLVPPLPMLGLSFLLEGPGAMGAVLDGVSPLVFGSTLFIAYGSTLLGYGIWNVLLGRYPAGVVAPFSLLVPIVGIGASMVLLGEPFSALEAVGSTLVFAGLLLNVFGPRLRAHFGAKVLVS